MAVYVANESPTDVYFDNLEIELEQYQENHYYPFGLNMAGIEREELGLQIPEQFQYLFVRDGFFL